MADRAYPQLQGPDSPALVQQSTPSEASAHITDSQQLSLTSSNSQLSQKWPSSSGQHELSQGSILPGTKTPSTSLSDGSSQEYIGMEDIDAKGGRALSELETEEHSQSRNLPTTQASQDRVYHTSAPKRMADGEVKPPETFMPIGPVSSDRYGHSRNSSRTSRSSQISELSSELKTRLSYAMVKVRNGWQSQTIGDLEILTSTQNSPSSAASEQGRLHALSVGNNPPADFPHLRQASVRASEMTAYSDKSPQNVALSAARGRYSPEAGQDQVPLYRAGSAYESFWREHEGGARTATQATSFPLEGPCLAPPLDIIPRRPRPLDTTNQAPPPPRRNDLSKPQIRHSPKTPSPKKSLKLRTPSQQAAVEQDAVETLLFMSSPNNSGYYPRIVPSRTPPKGKFVSQMRDNPRPGGFLHGNGGDDASLSLPLKERSVSRNALTEACVDRLLDEMPDTSSSEEENPQFSHSQNHEHTKR